jgi:hypothetical protein
LKVLYTPKFTIQDGKKNYILLWHSLVINLWNQLTESQKKKLIIINPYNENIKVINFNSILDCFSFNYSNNIIFKLALIKFHMTGDLDILKGFNYHKNCGNGRKCICGINIIDEHVIKHLETETFCIIGSECIKWWERINFKQIKNLKKIENNFRESEESKRLMPIFCSFCKKEKSCINCKQMKNIRIILYEWNEIKKKSLKKQQEIFVQKWLTIKNWMTNEYKERECSYRRLLELMRIIENQQYLPESSKDKLLYKIMMNDDPLFKIIKQRIIKETKKRLLKN